MRPDTAAMTLTGHNDVKVHADQRAVLIHASKPQEPEAVRAVSVAANLYPEMYCRLVEGEDPGDVVINFPYVWNFRIGRDSGVSVDPLPYPDTGLFIPQDFSGIVYFLFNVRLREASIEYATALPEPAEDVYYRVLANVSRGTGTVSIRQRFFGMLTVPSEDTLESGLGVFGS